MCSEFLKVYNQFDKKKLKLFLESNQNDMNEKDTQKLFQIIAYLSDKFQLEIVKPKLQ